MPNMVVRQHRWKANLYWLVLLIGYLVYIFTVGCVVKMGDPFGPLTTSDVVLRRSLSL